MKFITGKNRQQVQIYTQCLDETIDQDNEIRLIDLFVDSLKLSNFGFKMDFIENGRPAYHPADLLKLFIYGYLNRMRSSRVLEKECKRNIELMWLLKGLAPDHNTISNFRKDNPKAIQKVFQQTVKLANHFDLIGGKLLAGDSTKLRAQNSKKNNFNPKKMERSEHADLMEANKKRMDANKELYRKRQAIVEHPYGIIKRQWGFYFISTKKGIKRAAADVGLIFVAYNLRRIFNLIDKNELKKFLKELALLFHKFIALLKQFLAPLMHPIFNIIPAKHFFNLRIIAPFD